MNTWGYKIVLFDSGVDAEMEDGNSYKGELK